MDLRQVAVLTGTVKNLDIWKSKKDLTFGKLDLELNEGIQIRGLIFPDDWKKLKPHLENEMEITAVGKIDLVNDYVIIISSITIFPQGYFILDFSNEFTSFQPSQN